MNIFHLRLDGPSGISLPAPRVVFPEVRYFAPHNSFQPVPRINGQPLMGCPGFKTQVQAAYFIVALHRELGLPPPEFTADLVEEEKLAVERKVAELIGQRRLEKRTPVNRYTTTRA